MTSPSPIVERTEFLTPGPAEALSGLLGVDMPDLESGESLPLFWHWLYLLDRPAQTELGEDGHAVDGIPSPPGPQWRRMFAGARVQRFADLVMGREATRRTWLASTERKRGRSGELVFATVHTDIWQDGVCAITEETEIVYVKPGPVRLSLAEAPQPAPAQFTDGWTVSANPVLLFRFSALTYNSHRIHYDREYCREQGYPGLVVHGPLQGILMTELARHKTPLPVACYFTYRLTAPVFEDQGLTVMAAFDERTLHTRVQDGSGRETAVGYFAPLSAHGVS